MLCDKNGTRSYLDLEGADCKVCSIERNEDRSVFDYSALKRQRRLCCDREWYVRGGKIYIQSFRHPNLSFKPFATYVVRISFANHLRTICEPFLLRREALPFR